MLVTHGKIAAEELPSSVMVAEAALRCGAYVPATLVIEELIGPGKRFVVPRIHITGTSLNQLQAGQIAQGEIGPAPTPVIDSPSTQELNAAPPSPPASPDSRRAISKMLEQVPEEWHAERDAEWQQKIGRALRDPEFSEADAEAAAELIMPYLERAEKETNG